MKTFLAAIAKDAYELNKAGFFASNNQEKNKIAKKILPDYPESLIKYLAGVTENKFFEDISFAILWLKNPSQTTNKLLESVAEFICKECQEYIDTDKKINTLSKSVTALKERYGVDGLQSRLKLFLSFIPGSEQVIVQSASDLKPKDKDGFRTTQLKSNSKTLTIFKKAKQLLGGVRVFKQGNLKNSSWQMKLDKLDQIVE